MSKMMLLIRLVKIKTYYETQSNFLQHLEIQKKAIDENKEKIETKADKMVIKTRKQLF